MMELLVEGMHCNSCVARITSALHRSNPSAEVTVDLPARRVRVSGIDGSAARKAIEGAGYTARVALFSGESP